jgi:hypothetical protein
MHGPGLRMHGPARSSTALAASGETVSTDNVTVVLTTSVGRDRWRHALGSLGVPVPHGWRSLSGIFDDAIRCALNCHPPPIRWVS